MRPRLGDRSGGFGDHHPLLVCRLHQCDLYERAVPIFVDVDPRSGNIDPEQVRVAVQGMTKGGTSAQKWLPRTGVHEDAPLKAILPVDVFGQPADLDPILETARANNLKIIEDSCEAIGA